MVNGFQILVAIFGDVLYEQYQQFLTCKSTFHSVYDKDEVLMAVGITAVSCSFFGFEFL